jgi:hypothetical protein
MHSGHIGTDDHGQVVISATAWTWCGSLLVPAGAVDHVEEGPAV